MTNRRCTSLFKRNPIIAAVRTPKLLEDALSSDLEIIFLLCGNVFNLEKMVSLIHRSGKRAFVHLDLVKGFAQDSYFVKYLADEVKPEGVISTKNALLQRAKQDGLTTIQRVFLLDSSALEVSISSIQKVRPNAVEILPGCSPKLISKITQNIDLPIITGGFVDTIEEIKRNLEAGALSCSTSDVDLWSTKLNLKE